MSFSNLLRRTQRESATAPPRTPERPASATASAEFWRAFLGRDAKPPSVGGSHEARIGGAPPAAARVLEAEPMPSVEPAEIARELGLSRFSSIRALQGLRREFALKNHPDRVPSRLRPRATKRMMVANALIDSALKRFGFGVTAGARTQPVESGERI